MKEIKIVKNRSDIGAGTRGSDMGIDAMEIAAIVKGDDYFNRYKFLDVETKNESIYNKVNNSFAKRIKDVSKHCERVAEAVRKTLSENFFPIILSGDHSSALGSISGVKLAYPNQRIGVIWIDAHADLHSPHTSPSGNIHGMPLSAAIADDNLDCKINTITEDTKTYWDRMKSIGNISPKILPQDIVFFGVRDLEAPEQKQIDKYNIKNYTVAEVRYRGLKTCTSEAILQLKDCDILYISFDVDSMDCDLVSHGTGTPVEKGFDHQEIIAIIRELLNSKKVIALEVTEINPLLDNKCNKMAETAFDVLQAVTKTLEEN